jgi:hypothetical protein
MYVDSHPVEVVAPLSHVILIQVSLTHAASIVGELSFTGRSMPRKRLGANGTISRTSGAPGDLATEEL